MKNQFKNRNILSFKQAKEKISKLKKQGKTIGLCHGGFDLVHPGHIKHFESASKLCDVLFVSLTSDKYVRKRKGKNRPIYNQVLRAYLISSCKFVDYVTISDFEKGVETISFLKPTFYIKGPDYKNKNTEGIKKERQEIKKIGGRILYTKDIKFSTSKIIDKINSIKRKKLLVCLDRDGTIIKRESYLGKEKNYEKNIIIRRDVIDNLHSLNQKFDVTFIVISNQSGVARGYFNEKIVKKINSIIDKKLKQEGINIKDWNYCPYTDEDFAKSIGIKKFKKKYVKKKSGRKPSDDMVKRSLKNINENLNSFEKIIVFGDSEDDKLLAKNLNAAFIEVNNKNYKQIKNQLDSKLITS